LVNQPLPNALQMQEKSACNRLNGSDAFLDLAKARASKHQNFLFFYKGSFHTLEQNLWTVCLKIYFLLLLSILTIMPLCINNIDILIIKSKKKTKFPNLK
jgi:hypothetical protein